MGAVRRLALPVFVGVQTFALLAREDRWDVLLYFTRETWLLILLYWIKDLALAGLAGLAFALLMRWARALPAPLPARRASLLAAAGLAIAAGVALRAMLPREMPPGLWFDVPWQARALLVHPDGVPWIGGTPLMDAPLTGNHELVSYLYLHAYDGIFRIFGRAEPGFVALSAVPGCLALLGALWLGAEVFGLSAALFGLSFVAICRWPLVFSRWSYTGAALIPCALLAAAAALASLRTRRTSLAVLSGLLTGLSLHTHSSAWSVAAGLGVFSLLALRERAARRLIAWSWVAAFLAFSPFGWGYLRHPECLGGRIRDVPVGSGVSGAYGPSIEGPLRVPATLASNAIQYSGILLFTRDMSPRNGIPGRPAVTPLLGLACLVGLGLALERNAPGDRALLLVLAGSLAGGVFSNPGGAPNGIRICVVVIPALLAAGWLCARLAAALAETRRVRAAFIGAGIVASVVALDTMPFISLWSGDPSVVRFFCPTETQGARVVRALAVGDAILDPKALLNPFVFDALSGPVDPRVPIRIVRRATPAELLAVPPPRPFWYLARSTALAELRAAGWRCARGIAPHDADPAVVLARVVPNEEAGASR